MTQSTDKQKKLAIELRNRLLATVCIFAEAHEKELGESVATVILNGIAFTAARLMAAGTDTEEEAQYNAEVFAKELMATVKALKSQKQQ